MLSSDWREKRSLCRTSIAWRWFGQVTLRFRSSMQEHLRELFVAQLEAAQAA